MQPHRAAYPESNVLNLMCFVIFEQYWITPILFGLGIYIAIRTY